MGVLFWEGDHPSESPLGCCAAKRHEIVENGIKPRRQKNIGRPDKGTGLWDDLDQRRRSSQTHEPAKQLKGMRSAGCRLRGSLGDRRVCRVMGGTLRESSMKNSSYFKWSNVKTTRVV